MLFLEQDLGGQWHWSSRTDGRSGRSSYGYPSVEHALDNALWHDVPCDVVRVWTSKQERGAVESRVAAHLRTARS
jgi:hypothetical protein